MNGIYESSPDQQRDSDLETGDLSHLVVGNSGRLLDTRRTPVAVTGVMPALGAFELEIRAFEDTGARWQLPLDEVDRLQFPRGANLAGLEMIARLQASRARFARVETIESDPASRRLTQRRLATERFRVREWLARQNPHPPEVASLVARREGDPELFALAEKFLGERDLRELTGSSVRRSSAIPALAS